MDVIVDGANLSQATNVSCCLICTKHDSCRHHSIHQFCNPSYYTLRTCGTPTYNVCPHSYQAFDCDSPEANADKKYSFDVPSNIKSDNTISCTFPSVHQHEGTYKLMVCLFYTDGHSQIINYGNVFNMDNCCDSIKGTIKLKVYEDCVFINNEE